MGIDVVHAALSTPYIKTLLATKAHQLSRHARFRLAEQPDLEQDLVTHVLKQAHHYDPSRASVNTFIARVVDSAIAMMIRDRSRTKRAAGYQAISLDNTFVGTDRIDKGLTLGDVVDEGHLRRRCGGCPDDGQDLMELRLDLAQAISGLTPQQREVASRLPAPEATIARDLGISRRQVRNAVAAIRVHFECCGLGQSAGPGQSA
jgi:RNA polymerase sigma factor (sigma-70 family)